MKLNTLCGHLLSLLDREMSDFTELLRALKEGNAAFDDAELDKKTRRVAKENNVGFERDVLKARPGPSGGLDADPFNTAFLLLALMIEAPRREIVHHTWTTWHMIQEGSKLAGWGADWQPKILACKLTGRALFGDAFRAILADRKIANRVDEIRVFDDRAEIVYDKTKHSRFNDISPRVRNLFRVSVLRGDAIKYVAQLLTETN